MTDKPKHPAAVALGSMTSPAKARAARINGKLGGRPKGSARQRRKARRAVGQAEQKGQE